MSRAEGLMTELLSRTDALSMLFETSADCVTLLMLDGRVARMNQNGLCGMEIADPATVVGAEWATLWPAAHRDEIRRAVARASSGEVARFHGYRPTARGAPKWWDVTLAPISEPGVGVVALLSVSRDVSEKGRYRLLAENVSDIVGLHDEHGRCLYISPSAEQIFGYAPEEVIGQTPFHFIPEHAHADFHALQERLARLPRGETVTEQVPMRHKDGRSIWVELACRIIEDECGRLVTVVVTRDITDRLETERRYRLLAENTADMLVLADLDGRAIFVAGACERVLGWTPDEVLALRGERIIHPEDYPRVHEIFLRVARGERDLHARYRSRAKDGSWRWLESNPSLYVEEAGAVGVVDAVRDVTDQVAQERALARAREEAEAAALARSQFLANMSHEIRTPLTSVIGFADLLLGRDDLQPDVRRYADRIGSASRALLTIVNDVLDFSKIEAGQFEIHPAPAQPREVFEEALAIFGSAAEAKGLRLRLDTQVAAATTVEIDAARVRQVLLNLVGNAVKFTDTGEVVVRLSCADGRMAAAVEDTGAGIDPEDQRKLFQRFSQIDDSTTRRHGGTGLGLAICRGLVEAMGGTIELRSRPGEGSTFAFEIAAPEATPELAGRPGQNTDAHVDRLRILVADDNPANRELVRAVLEGLGADVAEAADGQEALDVAAAGRFDVILMDLRMPRLDGRGALDALRRSAGPNQQTPVLAFTADVLEPELAAFNGRVAKPIEFARLVEAIEACLPGGPVAGPPAEARSGAPLGSGAWVRGRQAQRRPRQGKCSA